jgi:acid phosphatase family membrane protein YuiD
VGIWKVITPYLYVPLVAWAIAQLLKFFIALVRGDADLRYLYASGGMPSVHSAIVCSLAAYALFNAGAASPLFGITAIFAAIVMYDSFGVRRAAGEQARAINQLVDELDHSGAVRDAGNIARVREILGHKPFEVLAGAVLGIVTALMFSLDTLGPKLQRAWLLAGPMEVRLLYGVLALVAICFVAGVIVSLRKTTRSQRPTAIRWLMTLLILVLVVGFELFAIRQQVAYFSTVASAYVVAIVVVMISAGIIFRLAKLRNGNSKSAVSNNPRKDAWLKKAGKKK